jgi:hypothetical protein
MSKARTGGVAEQHGSRGAQRYYVRDAAVGKEGQCEKRLARRSGQFTGVRSSTAMRMRGTMAKVQTSRATQQYNIRAVGQQRALA